MLRLSGLLLCVLLSWLGVGSNKAEADCSLGACLFVGPELASINSDDGPVLNLVTQLLLDSSVAVSVSNWEGVAQTEVTLLGLLEALQLETSAADTNAALVADITLLNLLDVVIAALQNEGDAVGVSEVQTLRTALVAIPDMNGSIQLGNLITLADTTTALLDVDINVLHLLLGSLQLFNSENTLDTPTPLTVTTAPLLSALGLGGLASSVQVSLRVTEPPAFVCGPVGISASSATVRLKLDVSLVPGIGFSDNSLGSVVDVSLSQLSLYLELAPAQAQLTGIAPATSSTGAVNVDATHGIARLYLGQFDDSQFFNPLYSPPLGDAVYGDLAHAEVGELDLLGNTAAISLRTYAEGTQTTTGLFFSSFPETRTADSSVGVIGSLIADALTELEVDIDGGGLLSVLSLLGLTLNQLIDAITTPLGALLDAQLLSPLLTDTIDSLLSSLGVAIGKVVVYVGGFAGACEIDGRVFQDTEPANQSFDPGENWENGTTVWVHALRSGQLIASRKITPGTGQFVFQGLPLGDYSFVLSADAGQTSAAAPANWMASDPVSLSYSVSLLTAALPELNFALLREVLRISGRVFTDIGLGGGTANDGVQNGAESGIAGESVILTDSTNGEAITRVITASDGSFAMEVAASWQGQALFLHLETLDAKLLTGISAGDSGGSYDADNQQLAFTAGAATVEGIVIAVIPQSSLQAGAELTTGPGRVATIAHHFRAGSAGTLSLDLTPYGVVPSTWGGVLMRDDNCDGELSASESVWPGSVATAAGEQHCVLVKVTSPAAATEGAQASWQLQATFQLSGTQSELFSNLDVVTVSERYHGVLVLIKTADKSTALPGENLSYTLTYTNTGSEALSNLIVYDATPAFTTFQSSDCSSALGAGLTQCNMTAPAVNAEGSLQWDFDGELAPGAEGSLQFSVQISN